MFEKGSHKIEIATSSVEFDIALLPVGTSPYPSAYQKKSLYIQGLWKLLKSGGSKPKKWGSKPDFGQYLSIIH